MHRKRGLFSGNRTPSPVIQRVMAGKSSTPGYSMKLVRLQMEAFWKNVSKS